MEKLDLDKIIKNAEITLESCKHYKAQEIPRKEIPVKSLIKWCEQTISLCNSVKDLENLVKAYSRTVQKLAPRNREMEDELNRIHKRSIPVAP